MTTDAPLERAGDSPGTDPPAEPGGAARESESPSRYVDLRALLLDDGSAPEATRLTEEDENTAPGEDFRAALSRFRARLVRSVPAGNARIHQDMGTAYRTMGLGPEAIAEFQRAIRVDPANSAAHEMLGRSLLDAGQISLAEPLIRQYLEYKLQQIIRRVDIPVPIDFAIKDTKRMVSNCLEAITCAIELHKKAETLVLSEQQFVDIDTSHVPAIIGNWVSHYETGSGSSLSALVLIGVIDSIDALAECFKYDDQSGDSTVRRWYKSLDNRTHQGLQSRRYPTA